MIYIYRVIDTAKERLKYISERKEDCDLSNNEQLPKILLDLANYKYDKLIQLSLLLLNRYYTTQTEIFEMAFRTLILKTSESCALFNTLNKLFLKLIAFLRSGSSPSVVVGESPIGELTNYCWLEDEVEGFEPHQINQKIILSFGTYILRILYCPNHQLPLYTVKNAV